MAIQQIDLAVPNGDTVRSANIKINQNFSNSAHSASRMIGTSFNQIPLAQQAFEASHNQHFNSHNRADNATDLNTLPVGYSAYISRIHNANAPMYGATYGLFQTRQIANGNSYQIFYAHDTGEATYRAGTADAFSDWRPMSQHSENYRATSASNANVFVDSSGKLMRSTSSMKYKDLIGQLELDDENYKKTLKVKPIIYRSKSEADPSHWHYLSFSAEELGEYDPALTQWKTHETITDEETGAISIVELDQKEAEGINLNAICAVLHATNIKQAELIDDLKARVEALEKGA